MTAHAFLSASGSKIWLACTPAARAQEKYPDEDSEFSLEGTFGHDLADAKMAAQYDGDKDALNVFHAGNQDRWQKYWTLEFDEYVQGYVNRCLELIAKVKAECPDAIVLREQKLDFSDWVPQGFGTGDLVIVADKTLYVRDLKMGRGVRVDAQDNSQCRLYGAGALATYGMLYGFENIDVSIDQPRLDHLDSEVITRQELAVWMDDYVKPRAAMAWNGEGEFVAGEHCTFCRARHECRKRAEYNAETVAKYSPDDDFATFAPTMSDEEIAALLPRLDDYIKWAKGLKAWALREQTFERRTFPGLKLVAGRSVRKIVDYDALVKKFTTEGIDEALLYERTTLGITAIEKLVGKKKFAAWTEAVVDALDGQVVAPALVHKPPGKPKLVLESDQRPAWVPENAADIDFGDLEDE